MIKTLILSLILVVLGYQRLLTSKIYEQLKSHKELNDILGKVIEIPETTCNVVDPTPILPEGMEASEFVTRSGYLKMGKGNSAFGFIFWGAMAANGDDTKLSDYPTLIWLQGGPGGSSQFGDFSEMGPIMVTGTEEGKFTYTYNPSSWNQQYNIIFIDNPIGTGLSQAETILDIPTDQDEVAKDLYNGLVELYTAENGCFNLLNLQESPLIVSGESYAGKYVPSIAWYILNKGDNEVVNKALKGIAVGDGFTDPKTIMTTLPQFGYNLSMLNKQEYEVTDLNAKGGVQEMVLGNWLSAKQAFDQVMSSLAENSGLQNPYDWADNQNAPSDFDLTAFMNSTAIKTDVFQFPAELDFSEFSGPVYLALSNDFMKYNVVNTVKKILKKNFPVLYYNGQNDVIVCTPCTENWLDQVKYSGQAEFAAQNFTTWETKINGQPKISGYYKQVDNLSFVTINQAGHMVPADQPEAAYNMISEFVDYVVQRDQVEDKVTFDREFGMFSFQDRTPKKNKKQEHLNIVNDIIITDM